MTRRLLTDILREGDRQNLSQAWDEAKAAEKVLKQGGFSFDVQDVVVLHLPDRPGALIGCERPKERVDAEPRTPSIGSRRHQAQDPLVHGAFATGSGVWAK